MCFSPTPNWGTIAVALGVVHAGGTEGRYSALARKALATLMDSSSGLFSLRCDDLAFPC